MRVRERVKEDSVDHREYPSGGSNPKHQAEHGRSRKTRILAHHADGKLEVLPESFHGTPLSVERYVRNLLHVPDN